MGNAAPAQDGLITEQQSQRRQHAANTPPTRQHVTIYPRYHLISVTYKRLIPLFIRFLVNHNIQMIASVKYRLA